jgi:signal transduction histidine kinase
MPHLFERFRQGESGIRRPGGLGLGLSISKQLIELHGGNITAESEGEGHGATFRVTFPV